MVKAYKVAELVFQLELKDESVLWEHLGQYSPFEVDPVEDPLFKLNLCKELPEKESKVVYDAETEPGETVIRLFKGEGFWDFEMAPNSEYPVVARARCSEDFREAELCIVSRRLSDAIFSINNTMMLLFAFSAAGKGVLEMHASVIRNAGKGYLFLAKSGTGKSTHSQLWLDNIPGSDLLNDDNPVVRVWPDGRIIVYGSPWSGKTPCYRNIECPVGAFVQIRRCAENKITRLELFESYALIYSSSSGFKTDARMGDQLHATLEKVVTGSRCYVLDCRPDAEAAQVCSSEVLKEE